MTDIYKWSSTAASNANADSAITWSEGQNPNTVNDSARQMMKRTRDLLTDIAGATLATGTANGLLLTAANAFTTLATGRIVCFRAAADNTGAATLNVNGIGAKSIRYLGSSGDAALSAGMIQEDGVYIAIYGEHFNSSGGGWMLVNPTVDLSTLSSVVLTTPQINDTSSDHQYVFAVSELTADRTITLPLLTGDDEFVFKAHTQTLTNKDISATTNTYRQATDSAIGAVELATAAEIRTGTDDTRAVTIDKVYDAAARVQLTDAATIAVDMATFINAYVEMSGNRILGTPTNCKDGQSGVIRAQAVGATRTLTFASGWFLADPSAVAISSGHELYLYYHVFSTAEPVVVVSPIYNPAQN